tara:strand:+ start:4029 stop:5321 length:1293 start_codon:yes stop_codon:yes gene_type:complete
MFYEVENMILGNIVQDSKRYFEHAQTFNSLMFEDINNVFIYKAFVKLVDKGINPDILSLNKEIGNKKQLNQSLVSLVNQPLLMHNEFQTGIMQLYETSQRKLLASSIIEINNSLQNSDSIDKIKDKVDALQNKINNPNDDKQQSLLTQLIDFTDDLAKRRSIDGISGITTGFKSLDDFTNGWQKTDLVIIGGASSMGKTSFAVTTAFNSALANKGIAIFSYEMSSLQLIQRMVSLDSGVHSHWIRKGALDEEEMKKINKSVTKIENLPIIIDDCNQTSLSYLLSKIKQYAITNKVELILVDYLQLVSASGGSREQEVSKVARALKNIAKELNVAIIALSQLNRGVGMRHNSKPTMADLRESGEIEQAADIVALIYRPEYYGLHEDESGNPTSGLAKIIFAKGRNIGVGEINLKFIANLTKFEDYESSEGF